MSDMRGQDYINLKRQEDIFLCQVHGLNRIGFLFPFFSIFCKLFILKIVNVCHVAIMAGMNIKAIIFVFEEVNDRIT